MKNNKELDVDFIGGQEPLTDEEKNQLSKYFAEKKSQKRKSSTTRRSNRGETA